MSDDEDMQWLYEAVIRYLQVRLLNTRTGLIKCYCRYMSGSIFQTHKEKIEINVEFD